MLEVSAGLRQLKDCQACCQVLSKENVESRIEGYATGTVDNVGDPRLQLWQTLFRNSTRGFHEIARYDLDIVGPALGEFREARRWDQLLGESFSWGLSTSRSNENEETAVVNGAFIPASDEFF